MSSSAWKPLPPYTPPKQFDPENKCDWNHIPTQEECLRLLTAGVWHLEDYEWESPYDYSQDADVNDPSYLEEMKSFIKKEVTWSSQNSIYQYPTQESTIIPRMEEEEIRKTYIDLQQTKRNITIEKLKKFIPTLKPEGWKDMCSRFQPACLYEINWLLYLESIQEEQDDTEIVENTIPTATVQENTSGGVYNWFSSFF